MRSYGGVEKTSVIDVEVIIQTAIVFIVSIVGKNYEYRPVFRPRAIRKQEPDVYISRKAKKKQKRLDRKRK
jgi:hypothetical protein